MNCRKRLVLLTYVLLFLGAVSCLRQDGLLFDREKRVWFKPFDAVDDTNSVLSQCYFLIE